jgi:hypothetical protein
MNIENSMSKSKSGNFRSESRNFDFCDLNDFSEVCNSSLTFREPESPNRTQLGLSGTPEGY